LFTYGCSHTGFASPIIFSNPFATIFGELNKAIAAINKTFHVRSYCVPVGWRSKNDPVRLIHHFYQRLKVILDDTLPRASAAFTASTSAYGAISKEDRFNMRCTFLNRLQYRLNKELSISFFPSASIYRNDFQNPSPLLTRCLQNSTGSYLASTPS